MEHHFNIEIAKEYGVDIAIFLQNLAFWTLRNVANKSNFIEGRYWIYNTQEAWTILFPYWSRQSIRRIINNCVKNGLIIQGNYNEKNYDKTIWYSMSDKCLCIFPPLKATIDSTKSLGWNQPSPVDKSKVIHNPWLEPTNGLVETNQAIPDSNPDIKEKSFCATAQKTAKSEKPKSEKPKSPKRKTDWRAENEKRPEWAEKMDNSVAGKKQMEREAKHIEESNACKSVPMPQAIRDEIRRALRR